MHPWLWILDVSGGVAASPLLITLYVRCVHCCCFCCRSDSSSSTAVGSADSPVSASQASTGSAAAAVAGDGDAAAAAAARRSVAGSVLRAVVRPVWGTAMLPLRVLVSFSTGYGSGFGSWLCGWS